MQNSILNNILKFQEILWSSILLTNNLKTKKTRATVFGFSHIVGQFDSLHYPGMKISEGETVEFVSEITRLWISLYSTLSWKPLVKQVAKIVNCALFRLRFSKSCTTESGPIASHFSPGLL